MLVELWLEEGMPFTSSMRVMGGTRRLEVDCFEERQDGRGTDFSNWRGSHRVYQVLAASPGWDGLRGEECELSQRLLRIVVQNGIRRMQARRARANGQI